MSTRVFLVRHASHDRLGRVLCGRMPGVTLSEAGLAEARETAGRLAQVGAAVVYASPLERTRQTAEAIAERCGAPMVVDEALVEVDFGEWAGADFETLAGDVRWRRWNEDRGRTCPPGGETLHEAQARIAGWLRRVADEHPDATVIGVSHSDIIKAGLAHVLGLPLHFYDRFDVDPASVSTVSAGDWGMKVHSINEAAR